MLRLDYEMRWYKVTDRSLRIREGVWRMREMTMMFDNIQNISITQGPIQRMLNIADLKVQTAGGSTPVPQQGQKGMTFDMHTGYFRGIDTADLALLGTLFTPDLTVDYRGGTYRVRLEGRDNMLEFLANSFHSGAVAMHHGHMPEITLTGENDAEGIWYLEDIFIDVERSSHTIGSAIYRDVYRREDGA